jgi:hypothetical protein
MTTDTWTNADDRAVAFLLAHTNPDGHARPARIDPDLSRLDRADRNLPPESWCAGCGHDEDSHTHWSDSTHCSATVDTFVQANVLRAVWCDCEAFTAPWWTVGQRVGVAVSVAAYLAILVVVAHGLGVGQ